MKKIVLVMLLIASGIALAQRGERNQMKDLSADQIATLQVKKATLALDLTVTQQMQLKTVFVNNAKMRKAKIEERKARKESGENNMLTSDERFAKSNERLDHQIAQKEKLKQILSDEQLEKWTSMKKRDAKHRRKDNKKRDRGSKK